MKKVAFLLAFFVFSNSYAQSPPWDWGRGAGGAGIDESSAICTSPNGYSYVTGKFNASAAFGSQTVNSYGGPDIFLAKYDPAGTCLWAKHGGSVDTQDNDGDEGKAVALDASGNCYVTGNFKGAATFGSLTLSAGTAREIFLVKYDSNGNELWARCPTGNGVNNNYSRGVSVDAAGNIWITGALGNGNSTFGSFTLTGPGGFIAQYDPNGNVLNTVKIGTYGNIDLVGIDTDNSGNVFVTGELLIQETIGSQTYVANGFRDAILIKMDPAGNFVWLKQSDTPYSTNTWVRAVCCDQQGGIYISGYYVAQVSFGIYTLNLSNQNNSADIFLVKYDTNGNEQWAVQSFVISNSTLLMDGAALTVSPNSTILMTGVFTEDFVFGSVYLSSSGSNVNTYIAEFSTSGTCLNANVSTGINTIAFGTGISTDNLGGVYITGYDKSRIIFGQDTTAVFGPLDVFVARAGLPVKIGIGESGASANAGFIYNNQYECGLLNLSNQVVPKNTVFRLHDMAGRLILEVPVNSDHQQISLNGIAKGVYSWSVMDSESRIGAGKIVVGE